MNNFFDTDFIIIIGGLIAITTIEKINPYVAFFGAIIVIIAGIYKIINLYYSTKKIKEELKKLKQEKEIKD